MLTLKLIAAAGIVSSLVASEDASAAPHAGGVFLVNTPGVSVEYLIVDETGRRIRGDLEIIATSKRVPDGQVRTHASATSADETLVFGSRIARPSTGGYVVTSTAADGTLGELRFVRTNIAQVNAAIVSLSSSVSRRRIAFDRETAVAQLRTYSAMSAADALRLTKAQLAVANAATALNIAQTAADHLAAVARGARAEANAKVDESGVSLAQNESREAALKVAADADQSANAAQRQADLAGLALAAASSDVKAIRSHIAMVTQRTRALAAQATGDTTEGR